MKQKYFNLLIQVHEDGEYKCHEVFTHALCKRKFRRYLRKLLSYKRDNFVLDLIHVFEVDENHKRVSKNVVQFFKTKKDLKLFRYGNQS